MQVFSLYVSTFILVVIGYDQLLALRRPIEKARNRGCVRKLLWTVWLLSALLSLPQVFIFRVQRGPFQEEFYQCVTYGFYSAQWQEQLYTTISLVLMFLLPLATLVTTYLCTFYTISVQRSFFDPAKSGGSSSGRSAMEDARRKLLHKAKMKSLMITVVIVLAFIICWTPYYCMMIIFIFLDPDDQLTEELQAGIFFFGSSTAMINPIIYGVFHLRRNRRGSSKQYNSSMTSRGVADYPSTVHNKRTLRARRGSPDGVSSSSCVNGGRPLIRLKYSVVSNGCLRQKETALVTVQPER
ncbi:gonadotropin-releasing hormone receptor-like isoform X2 [Ornithodoros turicata]|uniref:gonadotropin-releasing hormone receptor-like isoform X2 n=1 Tax=Ornithodoros turicata TaxID=34597 RepID=UPI00313A3CF2